MDNSRVPLTFSESDLKELLKDAHSCVSLKKCKRHLAVGPSSLGDITRAIRDCLDSLVPKFDSELDGLVLGYRKLKLLSGDGGILNDAAHIHLDVITKFFVFKPEVGSILTGVVKEKSPYHIGGLVHKVFNVSIFHPNANQGENSINIGQQVTFKVDEVNLSDALPYIKGTLISVGENQILSGTSDFMEEFLAKKKRGSEKYLLQKKKEKVRVAHNNEEDGMEDITAAEDLIDTKLPYFPTSILKKRDSSEITSPSKRITFGSLEPVDDMSEESDLGHKKSKKKRSLLSSSQIDALNINKVKLEQSSPEKQKKLKREKEEREVDESDYKETEKIKRKKDKKLSDKQQENVNYLEVMRKIKREVFKNEDDKEAVPSKRKKKHLLNLDGNYLNVTPNACEVETKDNENEQSSFPLVKKHSKKNRKREYEENNTDNEADGQANISGAEKSLRDVPKSVKKKNKKQEPREHFLSPEANSTVIPGFRSPSGTLKTLKSNLFHSLSPIVKAADCSSGEENGFVTSTQLGESSRKRHNVQKSPSPSKIHERLTKEKNVALKHLASPTKIKRMIEIQSPTAPSSSSVKLVSSGESKSVLKTNSHKSSSSKSDDDTSSSEPPDEPSFQNFKDKLEKQKRVASDSDSSSSEPSDLSSVKQTKENAMKKILKTKSQRSVPTLMKPAGADSSSSEDSSTSQVNLSREKMKSKKEGGKNNSKSTVGLGAKTQGESKSKALGKEKKEMSDTKSKKHKKKENKNGSKTKSKEKEKSKSKGNSTEKATTPDTIAAIALAEKLLKNFMG